MIRRSSPVTLDNLFNQIEAGKLKDLNILAMDMESASVGHVCYLYKKPVLIIRSISDCLASPTSQFDYFEFADKASLRAAKMLKSIL